MLLLTALTSFAADQSYNFPTNGRFVLHGPSAREIFHQCSRTAPARNSELWEPSNKDINDLEIALTKYLNARAKEGRPHPPNGINYHRQYVGFFRNGERFIYGNFYPPADQRYGKYEGLRPIGMCDGGDTFWGIVYRVKTKTFEEPQFNGIG